MYQDLVTFQQFFQEHSWNHRKQDIFLYILIYNFFL